MHRLATLFGVFVVLVLLPQGARAAGNVDLPRYPSISPDGSTIAFSWRGDVFRAPTTGGTATRLTTHPGRDHRSAWLPDGTGLVFESDRDGVRNLYRMNSDGTSIVDGSEAVLTRIGRSRVNNVLVSALPSPISLSIHRIISSVCG